ncbi:MAG TPA: hypothetical protein VNT75_32150 [Symbiobacteriaceae bacterium]|nr:hypothetical protein [Symbiobacteriaceae bacterium]
MSEEGKLTQEELEEERRLKASVHRWLGVLATVLVVVAIGVALYQLSGAQTVWGMTFGEMMRITLGGWTWVAALLVVGLVFSLGTTRIMLGLEKLVNLIRGKKKAG